MLAALADLFLSYLLVGLPHPGIVLLTALATGMVRTPTEGAIVAFGGGVLLDLFAGPPVGRITLALVLATLPVFLKYTEMARRTVLAPVLAAGLGTLIFWIMLVLTVSDLGLGMSWPHLFMRVVVPSLFVNTLLALAFLHLIARVPSRRGPKLTTR